MHTVDEETLEDDWGLVVNRKGDEIVIGRYCKQHGRDKCSYILVRDKRPSFQSPIMFVLQHFQWSKHLINKKEVSQFTNLPHTWSKSIKGVLDAYSEDSEDFEDSNGFSA